MGGQIRAGMDGVKRLVRVDQRPIGRTPRSNLATYTGLFDHVRKLFASTETARARRYDAGRFSFNVAKGRCEHCEGEGFVSVEMLFLPSVYAPCPVCEGARYNADTLAVTYRERSIADVLGMTVDAAYGFFEDEPTVRRALHVVREVGLGYLRLGQPATELSGGEAQRIKLATELQRAQRGDSLYVLDEPTTGLHPTDVERLLAQLDGLVRAGNTVVVVEHDMRVVAASDWVIDVGIGRAHDGPAPGGRRAPRGAARRPGGRGQHGDRGGARHARGGRERLGHRRGAPGAGRGGADGWWRRGPRRRWRRWPGAGRRRTSRGALPRRGARLRETVTPGGGGRGGERARRDPLSMNGEGGARNGYVRGGRGGGGGGGVEREAGGGLSSPPDRPLSIHGRRGERGWGVGGGGGGGGE